jgi:hypothetical protein
VLGFAKKILTEYLKESVFPKREYIFFIKKRNMDINIG